MTIRKSLTVKRPLADAFSLFTEQIGSWWPLKQGFSFGGERAKEIYLETRQGGRFYERFTDGEEYVVGHVTACEPPRRIVFTWRTQTGRVRLKSKSGSPRKATRRAWKWSTAAGKSGPRQPRQARVTTADGISCWASTPPPYEDD